MNTLKRSFSLALGKRIQVGSNVNQVPVILKGENVIAFFDSEYLPSIEKNSSSKLSVWADRNGGAISLIQATETKRPLHFKDGVWFDGNQYHLKSEAFAAIPQPTEVFMLVRQLGWSVSRHIISGDIDSEMGLLQHANALEIKTSNGSLSSPYANTVLGNWQVIRILFNGAGSEFQVDDNPVITGNWGSVNTLNAITVGARGASLNFNGNFQLKALIYKKTKATTDEKTIIYNYLRGRIHSQNDPKMVSLGDSIAFQMTWQPHIADAKKYYHSGVETIQGFGGYRAMGVGSSRIIPLINTIVAGQNVNMSIYERADDVRYYSPDIILLEGGGNDINATIGSISDEAYTGVAVSSNPPSFYSAFKGTLKKLTEQNPTARIICLSPTFRTDTTKATVQPYVSAVLECANDYNVEALDLLNNAGINETNYATYLKDAVHPNDAGGKLIADYIVSQI